MEFVLVMPLLFLLIVGVVEVGVLARTSLQLAAASREGARVAAAAPDTAKAIEAARGLCSARNSGRRARITISRPPVVGGQARVTVAINHTVLQVIGRISGCRSNRPLRCGSRVPAGNG